MILVLVLLLSNHVQEWTIINYIKKKKQNLHWDWCGSLYSVYRFLFFPIRNIVRFKTSLWHSLPLPWPIWGEPFIPLGTHSRVKGGKMLTCLGLHIPTNCAINRPTVLRESASWHNWENFEAHQFTNILKSSMEAHFNYSLSGF